MERASINELIDLNDRNAKRKLLADIGPLQGIYEIKIEPRRLTRTLAQNRLWHVAIVKPFYQFLHAQDYDISHQDQAHALLKEKFLRVPVVNKTTGEEFGWRTRSTTELDIAEFCWLVDAAAAWLDQTFGVICDTDKSSLKKWIEETP